MKNKWAEENYCEHSIQIVQKQLRIAISRKKQVFIRTSFSFETFLTFQREIMTKFENEILVWTRWGVVVQITNCGA